MLDKAMATCYNSYGSVVESVGGKSYPRKGVVCMEYLVILVVLLVVIKEFRHTSKKD
jgi:hypothetical protein